MEMPIIRKVITLKTSKAICIPKRWLEYYERRCGEEIREVLVEVNDVLKISPLLPRGKGGKNGKDSSS